MLTFGVFMLTFGESMLTFGVKMLTFGERAVVGVSGSFLFSQYAFPRKAVIKTEGKKGGRGKKGSGLCPRGLPDRPF